MCQCESISLLVPLLSLFSPPFAFADHTFLARTGGAPCIYIFFFIVSRFAKEVKQQQAGATVMRERRGG